MLVEPPRLDFEVLLELADAMIAANVPGQSCRSREKQCNAKVKPVASQGFGL